MSGILQAIGAGTQADELYDEPEIVDTPAYEPEIGDITGAPKQPETKYQPSVGYLEFMAGLAVLNLITIMPHLLHRFISNDIRATMAGMVLVLIGALALCFTVPPALRKSTKSKKHARRKLVLAVAMTAALGFVSWLLSAQ